MKLILPMAVAITLLTAACSSGPNVRTAAPVVGVWELESVSGTVVRCEGSVELREDGTFAMSSAEQVISGRYRLEQRGANTHLVQWDLRINDKPNCQGISANYVIKNYVYEPRIDVQGERMLMYPLPQAPQVFFALKRKPRP